MSITILLVLGGLFVLCVRLMLSGLGDILGRDRPLERPHITNTTVNMTVQNSFNGGMGNEQHRETEAARAASTTDYGGYGDGTNRWRY